MKFRRLLVTFSAIIAVYLLLLTVFDKISFRTKKKDKKNERYSLSLDFNCATEAKNINGIELVHGVKFVLYIICHDDRSCTIAEKWSKCMPWRRVVRIQPSLFFESLAYQTVFPSLEDEWRDLDFVGVSTYKSLKFLPLEKLVAYLELASLKPYDVVPLYGSGEFLMRQAVAGHGAQFQVAWDTTLRLVGFSEPQIRAMDNTEVFFRNTFLVRPVWMTRLVSFMNQSMHAVTHSAETTRVLSTDANYREGKLVVSRTVFGGDHYFWHPFVFERLPSFFFHQHGATVFQTLRQVSLFQNNEEKLDILYKGI